MLRLIGLILMAAAACLPAEAQDTRERIVIKQTFKGKAITITGELYLPPGGAKVPAMIVHHGSGGITDARERRYARELVKMGVAALVLDSFTGRGVTSTVRDQSAVSTNDMLGDAFAALKLLAATPGSMAPASASWGSRRVARWLCSRRTRCVPRRPCRRACALPCMCRSILPAPRSTTSPRPRGRRSTCCWVVPIPTWASRPARSMPPRSRPRARASRPSFFQAPCMALTAGVAYQNPRGENYSRCIFAQQPDGSWRERGQWRHHQRCERQAHRGRHTSRPWPSAGPLA